MTPASRFKGKFDDLTDLAREHYEVAASLNGPFTTSAFKTRYSKVFPKRQPGSILPSDYCHNHSNAGNASHPRFLIKRERASYYFVGLDQNGDRPRKKTVWVFRQDNARREELFEEALAGRLRQGWSYNANLSLHQSEGAWLTAMRAAPCDDRSPESHYKKLRRLLDVRPGDLLVVLSQPRTGLATLLEAVQAPGQEQGTTYSYGPPISDGDKRSITSVDGSKACVLELDQLRSDVAKAFSSAAYRYPISRIANEGRSNYLLTQWNGEGAPQSAGVSAETKKEALPFSLKGDADYECSIAGGVITKSRKHESLVRDAARAFEGLGWTAATPHPVDLLLQPPDGSTNLPLIVEAKIIRGNPAAAAREAIGQLFWYSFAESSRLPAAQKCVLLDRDPGERVVQFIEQSVSVLVLWFEDSIQGGPESRKTLGLARAEI